MVSLQKKIAAKILKCGVNRIWIDPTSTKVKQAITRNDVRRYINEGIIKKFPEKRHLKLEAKAQQRMGSRKGKRGAREGKKTNWLKIIRPQRKLLKEMKPQLEPLAYRKVYRMIKGNAFRSRAHLTSYLKDNKLIKEKGK
jgi:large subunit ribosomal protein L19e